MLPICLLPPVHYKPQRPVSQKGSGLILRMKEKSGKPETPLSLTSHLFQPITCRRLPGQCLQHGRKDLASVTYHSVIRHLHDGRLLVSVDGDDQLATADAKVVVDIAG